VTGEDGAARTTRRDADYLLLLALSRPLEALAKARAVLDGCPGPAETSVAHQAAGIVLRDIGDIGAGLRELRAALRAARRTGSADREADVLATLGLTLAYARRTPDALAAFDRSAATPLRWMTCAARWTCCAGLMTRFGPPGR
jgi:hypothetical protein